MPTYSIYTPTGCLGDIPNHYCNDCEEREHGRIRSSAFIAKDWVFIDPTNPLEWRAGIAQKKIIVIPSTNGNFDGGSEVTAPGYGDQETSLIGYNFVATFNDPNYKFNADFYNALKRSRNWRYAYSTETQTHITGKTVQVIPKNPVGDELTSEVVWNVQVLWSESNLPEPFNTPVGIFQCFDYSGVVY